MKIAMTFDGEPGEPARDTFTACDTHGRRVTVRRGEAGFDAALVAFRAATRTLADARARTHEAAARRVTP